MDPAKEPRSIGLVIEASAAVLLGLFIGYLGILATANDPYIALLAAGASLILIITGITSYILRSKSVLRELAEWFR